MSDVAMVDGVCASKRRKYWTTKVVTVRVVADAAVMGEIEVGGMDCVGGKWGRLRSLDLLSGRR